jgi:hypothetical protein
MTYNKNAGQLLSILVVAVFLSAQLSGCTKTDTSKVPAATTSQQVLAAPTLLATFSDDEKPDTPVDDSKHAMALQADKQAGHIVIEINKCGRGVAYIARDKNGVHVVHNGKRGKDYSAIDSTTLTLSSDGQRVAYGAKSGENLYVVIDGKEYGPFDDKGPPVFSPDCRHAAFEAQIGTLWHVFVDGKKSDSAVSYFDKPIFSGDSRRLVRLENTSDESSFRVVFSDLVFNQSHTVALKSLYNKVSEDFSRFAFVDNVDGKKQVKLFNIAQPDKPLLGPHYDEVRPLAFSRDAQHLSYVAKRGGSFFLVLDDREEAIPSGEYPWPPVILPDGKSAGVVIVGKKGAFIHHAFKGKEIHTPFPYKECADLVYSPDGASHAYVAIRNERFLIVTNGKEGPMFDRVISPQFSPDGKFVVYRARQDGRRFVVVADTTGRIIKEHPRYERVFETTFTGDGKSVAYGVKDGNQIWWKVEKLP